MSRTAWFASLLAIVAVLNVSALDAQSFQGTGQQATELFAMEPGLAVFDLEHQGAGAFRVRLLDEQGRVVEELAQATGSFTGSKAVHVPRVGRYLLDVSATGSWSVRRRQDAAAAATAGAPAVPDTASPVYRSALAAAGEVPTGGWLIRGLVGGALAGPIGAAVAVGLAGRSAVPANAGVANGAAEYGPAFEQAFAARVREIRRKKAIVGGMMGSGIFLAGLIYALDLASSGGGGTSGDAGGPPGGVLSVGQR